MTPPRAPAPPKSITTLSPRPPTHPRARTPPQWAVSHTDHGRTHRRARTPPQWAVGHTDHDRTHPRARTPPRGAAMAGLTLSVLLAAALAGCGESEFDYKISGDRPAGETRDAVARGGGTSVSHGDLMQLQQQYQQKVQADQTAAPQ